MSDVASTPRPPRRAALISGALGFAAAIGLLALLSSFASEPAEPAASATPAAPQPAAQIAAPAAQPPRPSLPVAPLQLRERPLPTIQLRPALEAAPPATGGQP